MKKDLSDITLTQFKNLKSSNGDRAKACICANCQYVMSLSDIELFSEKGCPKCKKHELKQVESTKCAYCNHTFGKDEQIFSNKYFSICLKCKVTLFDKFFNEHMI